MRPWSFSAFIGATLLLGGCHSRPDNESYASHHGRYVGIGIYSADTMWSRMAAADQSNDSAAATTADDQDVIVVVDSDTGEIRQCGNLSGHCVRMNPWTQPLPGAQSAPMRLTEHAAQIENSNNAVAADGNDNLVDAH